MTCVAVALMLSFLAPQEPVSDESAKKLEELLRKVETLEKDRARLVEQIDSLEKFAQEAAKTISDLKKQLQAAAIRPPAPTEAAGDAKTSKTDDQGPVVPVHGKVLIVQPDYSFMIIDLGEDDGVKEGWTFEVIRAHKETDGKSRNELLGKATFEKYVETRRGAQSKLKIIDGNPAMMKYGDTVVANRRLEPMAPAKGPGELAAAPPPGPRKFRIFGISEDTYHIDVGSRDGMKQSDKVYVYRDKRVIAQIRLDRVDEKFSAGKIIDGTKIAEPAQNDDVQLKDSNTAIVGKVKRIETTGVSPGAWIEAGQHHGVKKGMQFEVRRQGKAVGRIAVKVLEKYYSICEAVAPMTLEDLRNDDFIESVE